MSTTKSWWACRGSNCGTCCNCTACTIRNLEYQAKKHAWKKNKTMSHLPSPHKCLGLEILGEKSWNEMGYYKNWRPIPLVMDFHSIRFHFTNFFHGFSKDQWKFVFMVAITKNEYNGLFWGYFRHNDININMKLWTIGHVSIKFIANAN